MKKRQMILAGLFTMIVLSIEGASGVMARESGVEVWENNDSLTGYTATFRYSDEEAVKVELKGSFQFYVDGEEAVYAGGYNLEEGDAMENYLIGPEDWTKGGNYVHIGDEGYVTAMEKDDTGIWTCSLDLPGGYYLYQYNVYSDEETFTSIPDPTNIAAVNAFGAHQQRSQFYVPYNEETMSPYYDWSWCLPAEEGERGTLEGIQYEGVDGRIMNAEIYLPAHYDAEREKPYKVLYLSHGGWGDEGDWFYQGHAGNIMDRLAAQGVCEEFVIVTMNNDVFPSGGWWIEWEAEKYIPNICDCLIPYIEEHYNVSEKPGDRAFAGLSSGAVVTGNLLHHDPSAFGYFGLFSCSATYSFPELEDYSTFKDTDIFLAGGWADYCVSNKENNYSDEDVMVVTYAEKLDEKEIPYNNGEGILLVPGNHDWFTWPQVLKTYISTTLWKA